MEGLKVSNLMNAHLTLERGYQVGNQRHMILDNNFGGSSSSRIQQGWLHG